MKIRPYKIADYFELASWCNHHDNIIPSPSLFCEDGTFILELDDKPALTLTVLLTQSKHMSYFEFFMKNPSIQYSLEKEGKQLWDFCSKYAQDKGYQDIICFSPTEKLTQKYNLFGFKPTLKNLTGMVKVI